MVFSSVFDYYAQILTASCSFINQDVLLVSVCQAFMDSLDSCLIAGFRTHFLDYSKLQECTATYQHKVLHEMLQAAICAKMEYNNIKTVARKAIGSGCQAFPIQVNASHAEKTMACYNGGDDSSNKSNSTLGSLPLCCYGCGIPYPWLLHENGIYVIKCPNVGDPRIVKNARKTIDCIRAKRKKQQQDGKKHKNLATTNFADFKDESKERIRQ
jgi:hypothetical protein